LGNKKRPKIGSKRGERRRQLTTLSAAAIVTTSPDGTKRFLFIVFFCFFKVQQTVHKATVYSGPPSVLNSPAHTAAGARPSVRLCSLASKERH
jgi:hypothetical protein